jgi:hypothetical protein
MHYLFIGILILFYSLTAFTQNQNSDWQLYEANLTFPYGQLNPEAPEQLKDFAPMIGTCDCKSLRRNPDGSWQDTLQMIWTFKYVLNGTAIQDQTWANGVYATSIRQIHPDSSQWVVSYNSFPGVSTSPSVWLGSKEGDEIILSAPQKAPNGMDGYSKLRFYSISEKGFNWKGAWIDTTGSFEYAFWEIWCTKQN